MFRIINTASTSMTNNPLKTGLFTVVAVIMAGAIAGAFFGFDMPKVSHAQIIVTGPAPVVPVPPPPAIFIPVTPPAVPVPPPAAPNTPNTSNKGGNDNNDIVVTGHTQTDTETPPCCTAVTTPSVPPSIDIETPPCCTLPSAPPLLINIETPPCCSLPIEVPIIPLTPPVIVPPVIPPPIIPPPPVIPPPPSSSCISLTSNKTSITPGEAVTLTWAVDNDKPVTITDVTHSSTVTTSNNLTGTTVVNPTSDTTYHASVPSDQNNPHCTVTVKVIPPSTSSSSCTLLSADKTTVNPGDTVVLTWKVNNDSPVTITDTTHNTVATTSVSQSGTITVTPNGATTYHASVPSDQNNPNCTVSVTPPPPSSSCTATNSCGGGGGGYTPNVFFSSSSRVAPPLSSVYLSQIPYTGLDLGPVGTVLYWAMLVIWSLAAAYLILFGAFPLMRRKAAAFGGNVSDALNSQPAMLPAHAGAGTAYAMSAASIPAARPSVHEAVHAAAVSAAAPVMERSAPVAPRTAPSPRLEMSGDGFRKFATNGALTIDDIVKGLSRESGMELAPEPAHEEPVMEHVAPESAPQPVYEAPAPAPRAAAPARVQEAAPVHPDVIGFIGSILEGERDVVFATIRQINQAGHDVEEFVSHAILALDDAYHARIDGTPVHEDVKRVTDHCATPFLERLVTALTTAVDGSYSMGVTGIKLALTRALAVAQG